LHYSLDKFGAQNISRDPSFIAQVSSVVGPQVASHLSHILSVSFMTWDRSVLCRIPIISAVFSVLRAGWSSSQWSTLRLSLGDYLSFQSLWSRGVHVIWSHRGTIDGSSAPRILCGLSILLRCDATSVREHKRVPWAISNPIHFPPRLLHRAS
jgi:hypothetical protein